MRRSLITHGVVLLLLALCAWASPIVKSVDVNGEQLPAGDFLDGKLWLASGGWYVVSMYSPEDNRSHLPKSSYYACWVVIANANNIEEKCVEGISGIYMRLEDIRADGVRGRLWGAAGSWQDRIAYIIRWGGDRWEKAYTFAPSLWNADIVDIYTIDVLPDGRLVTLLYVEEFKKASKDVKLVIIDADNGKVVLNKSIADFGLDTGQEASFAVHDNNILIAQARRLEGGKYEIRVVAVDASSLDHKVIVQDVVYADYAWSLTVRRAATPKSYVAIALVRGGNYTISVYGPAGKAAHASVRIPGKWEKIDSAQRVLLTTTDGFYGALLLVNQSKNSLTKAMFLYLIGNNVLTPIIGNETLIPRIPEWMKWSRGGIVAYIKEWNTIILGLKKERPLTVDAGFSPTYGVIVITKDIGTYIKLVEDRAKEFEIVEKYREDLIKRAENRYNILQQLYMGYTNPNWWRHLNLQKLETISNLILSLLRKNLDLSLQNIVEKITIEVAENYASTLASELHSIIDAVLYMWISTNAIQTFAETVFQQPRVEYFVTNPDLTFRDCFSYTLFAFDNYVENAKYYCVNIPENVHNVRILIYYMKDIVQQEINALINNNYYEYLRLLKEEKKFAIQLFKILGDYLPTNVDNIAYQSFIYQDLRKTSVISPHEVFYYILARQGLEQLYNMLLETWFFEYTYILERNIQKPEYTLKFSREVYWLPAIRINVNRDGDIYFVEVTAYVKPYYKFRGDLIVEVSPVYNILGLEVELPNIAYERFAGVELRSNSEKRFIINFKKYKFLNIEPEPNGYRIKIYAEKPLIIDDKYTQMLKSYPIYGIFTQTNAYDRYFSKILLNITSIKSSGPPLTSGQMVKLNEAYHKLYLAVVGDNWVVGYRGGQVLVEWPGALFIDFKNGTQLAYLPPNVSSYKVVVDARDAREQIESYNLTLLYNNGTQISKLELTTSIIKGQQHELMISNLQGRIVVKPLNIDNYTLINATNVDVTKCFLVYNRMMCPRDVNGDGLLEDINGNGRLDFNDVVLFFRHFNVFREYPQYFDFNRNGRVDFNDVVTLYKLVLGAGT